MLLCLERQQWIVGEPLGKGGFGQVFGAKSAAGVSAAVKLVPKAPGAERELLFEDLAGIRNVVPIIDRGETEDSWVLVMPRAEKSLQQHLTDSSSPLEFVAVVAILSDIVTALVDLDGRVVHRDLKPENVLLLDSRWCLADFGIARYAEATTAPDTRKYAMSVRYAAPERWRGERATSASDVYALGVIAYELLAGSRPFMGPDFREQHLHSMPPPLPGVPLTLDALVQECLYKAPEARPSPKNLSARLARIATSEASSSGIAKLHEANRAEVLRRSETARRESEERSAAERRGDLVRVAMIGLDRISEVLRDAIIGHAPAAVVEQGHSEWTIRLNQAELRLTGFREATDRSGWETWNPPFDVIAYASLSLKTPRAGIEIQEISGKKATTPHGYGGRSHALWFCDAKEGGQYQWFETAFMFSPLRRQDIPWYEKASLSVFDSVMGPIQSSGQAPFSLEPGHYSAEAVLRGMSKVQVAWPFTVVNFGDLDEFIDRWASWLADASQGHLQEPRELPERPVEGSWRQGR